MNSRTTLVLEKENIEKIKKTKILLLGVGGVGSFAFEALVRMGIENIIIVDNDVFELSNLNRQLYALKETINKSKVDVCAFRALQINEKVNIIKINKYLTEENYEELFSYDFDYIIDAIDSMKVKKLIIKKALKEKRKIISVMGMGGKVDASKIKITNISDTCYDPIAKEIRQMVKKEKLKNFKVISSFEKPKISKPIGSVSYVPSIAGLLAVNYVINDIMGDKNAKNNN